VLLDREGKVAGFYRKVYVFWSENVHAGREGVKVFDTDFGRISLLTCFDANFSELWSEADAKGAEIVFWPSAYGGGAPLNGYAMIYGYYVVPVGWGNIIDSTGVNVASVEKPRDNQFVAAIDLDRTFVHKDYTADKIARLLKEHAGEVELERDCKMEGWNLLRSIKPACACATCAGNTKSKRCRNTATAAARKSPSAETQASASPRTTKAIRCEQTGVPPS